MSTPITTRLAQTYVRLLEQFDLTDVTVIGNSFGGWLAAEIALQASPRVSGVIIIDGIGIEVQGHPMTNVSGLSPTEIRSFSFHDPSKAPAPPNTGARGARGSATSAPSKRGRPPRPAISP